VSYYHKERLYLLKSVQYILLAGTGEAPLSAECAACARALLADGLEANAAAAVIESLTGVAGGGSSTAITPARAGSGALVPAAGGGALAGVVAGAPLRLPGMPALQREQEARERCELLAILILIYSQTDARCSPDRLAALADAMSQSLFHSAASSPHPPDSSAALAECLGSLLVLAALRPAGLLAALASGQPLADADVPIAGRARTVDAALKNWAPCGANAVVLLTWAAYAKLLAEYRLAGASH